MTMYLPNSAVRPTGEEAGEFIEVPDSLDRARADNPSDRSRATPLPPGSAQPPGRGETTHQAS
jgi:hypothetical protein